jgi:hypothetical protein
MRNESSVWPALPFAEFRDTAATLHMWTQIVGKIRLVQTPLVNHWWNVPLYVDARGLTTSLMPYGTRGFEMRFDFLGDELVIETTDGQRKTVPLAPRTVADFYADVMSTLDSVGIKTKIGTIPVEVPNPIPFDEDTVHRSYDADMVRRFFHVLVHSHRVFERFRGLFIGKSSPIQFFWGGFDLALARFSGRLAPQHPPVPNTPLKVVREAYSHETCAVGFCPGYSPIEEPFYYSYAYPEPEGYATAQIPIANARYDKNLREYVIPYDVVRRADTPDETLLAFLDSTYTLAANLADWHREDLERDGRQRARTRSRRVRPRPGAHH